MIGDNSSDTAGVVGNDGGSGALYNDIGVYGEVSGTNTIGGIAGQSMGATYNNVFFAGTLTSPGDSGGVIGVVQFDTFTGVFWDSTKNPALAGAAWIDGGAGGTPTGTASQSTAQLQMQATFSTYDFDTVWQMGPSGYPELQ